MFRKLTIILLAIAILSCDETGQMVKPVVTPVDIEQIIKDVSGGDDSSVVLHLNFDEVVDGKLKDVSGNNISATMNSAWGSRWTSEGRFGGAIRLTDMDDFIQVESHPDLEITDEITIQFWFFPEQSADRSNLISKRTSANSGGWAIEWNATFTDSPQIETWFFVEDDWWRGTRKKQTIDTGLFMWHHITATFDGDKIRQYINGELDIEVDIEVENGKIGAPPPEFTPLRIGQSATGMRSVIGVVDEFMIYNRVLSAEEIKIDFGITTNQE